MWVLCVSVLASASRRRRKKIFFMRLPKFSVVNLAYFQFILKDLKGIQRLGGSELTAFFDLRRDGNFLPKCHYSAVMKLGFPNSWAVG